MNEVTGRRRWRPTPVGLISGTLVGLGFGLSVLDWGFVALVGLGAFGPGILRELGWLRDRDEFQQEAARRAGYHGFLAAGLVAFAILAQVGHEDSVEGHQATPSVMLILAVMWFTGLLSALFSYWGPRRMAQRVLVIFGCAWLLFTVLGSIAEGDGMTLLMQSLVTLPFFALAWAGGRWPRIAGLLLLACAVFFTVFFNVAGIAADPLATGRIVVVVLFLGPLFSSGFALLKRDPDDEDPDAPLPDPAPRGR